MPTSRSRRPSIDRLVEALTALDVPAVGPRRVIPRTGVHWAVRSYYDVWESLPSVSSGLFGRGVIGFSEAGHERFAVLPEVMGDDLVISESFDENERLVVVDAEVTIHPPKTLGDLHRRRVRASTGNAQADAAGSASVRRTHDGRRSGWRGSPGPTTRSSGSRLRRGGRRRTTRGSPGGRARATSRRGSATRRRDSDDSSAECRTQRGDDPSLLLLGDVRVDRQREQRVRRGFGDGEVAPAVAEVRRMRRSGAPGADSGCRHRSPPTAARRARGRAPARARRRGATRGRSSRRSSVERSGRRPATSRGSDRRRLDAARSMHPAVGVSPRARPPGACRDAS